MPGSLMLPGGTHQYSTNQLRWLLHPQHLQYRFQILVEFAEQVHSVSHLHISEAAKILKDQVSTPTSHPSCISLAQLCQACSLHSHLSCEHQKASGRNRMLSSSQDKGQGAYVPAWGKSMLIHNLNHVRDRQMLVGGGCRLTKSGTPGPPKLQLPAESLHVSVSWQRTRQAQRLLTTCHNLLPTFPFVKRPRTLGARHISLSVIPTGNNLRQAG